MKTLTCWSSSGSFEATSADMVVAFVRAAVRGSGGSCSPQRLRKIKGFKCKHRLHGCYYPGILI
jgi:hypothetical protein